MTRSWLCALLLFAAVAAFDAEAARTRAVTPGDPGRCSFQAGPLMRFIYPTVLAYDGEYVYWVDLSDNQLQRVSIYGGMLERLADLDEDWSPLAMTVDDTSVYLAVIPFSFSGPTGPGSIVVVPKAGGIAGALIAGTLISGIQTPYTIETDATHVYWVDVGTIDFRNGEVLNNGKIERARKDGSERQALAQNLSAPLGIALDGEVVYYGETGLANDDPTVGVYRVAKSGGAITTIDDETAAAEMDVYGDSIVFYGGDDTFDNALFQVTKDGSILRTILVDDGIFTGPQVVDGRAYYYNVTEDGDSIRWISIEHPGDPVTVVEGTFATEAFVVDACSVVYGLADPEEIRRDPRY